MKSNALSDLQAHRFICNLDRAELHENYRCFSKGVRVALISLGYDETWVNGRFRELMDAEYFGDDVFEMLV